MFIDEVGLVSKNKMKYLFDNSFYTSVVRDEERVVAFLLTFAPGVNYNSPNYIWHSENTEDPNFVYIDRIVVHPNYQNMQIGSKLYNRLE